MRNWVKHKMKWVEGEGFILMENGRHRTVAFISDGIPGIAITLIPCGRWSITHVPSGYRVPGEYELLADAIDVAEDLCPGFDWVNLDPGPNFPAPAELLEKWQLFASASASKAERLALLDYMP